MCSGDRDKALGWVCWKYSLTTISALFFWTLLLLLLAHTFSTPVPVLPSQSLNIPLVLPSSSLLQISLISPELHFSLDFPNTFSAIIPWQISFFFLLPPGNHFLSRRCEDKKWTFLSSAVDLGSKEFTVAAVNSSVHAAVAGDKDSAVSEAHPSFHLRL